MWQATSHKPQAASRKQRSEEVLSAELVKFRMPFCLRIVFDAKFRRRCKYVSFLALGVSLHKAMFE
jgi:hypothetical protein